MNASSNRTLAHQAALLRTLVSEEAEGDAIAQTAGEIAYTFARQERWRYASSAMLIAARARPLDARWTKSVCHFALQLAHANIAAPPAPRLPGHVPGTISLIVCSITPSKLNALRSNLARIMAGEAWELIHIGDAKSLAEGYNRGVDQASGELIVLCHDDIEILCGDFAAKLRSYLSQFDVIGVAGSTRIAGPAWGWAGVPHVWCWVGHPLDDGRPTALIAGLYGPCVGGAQTLDGLFLAARRSVFDRLQFDSQTFDGFHFYDLDFTYRASTLGMKCGICLDITVFHNSLGNISSDFLRYAERFCAKFPEARSQEHFGPTMAGIGLTRREDLESLHQWLARWVSMSDGQLLSRVITGASEMP